MQPAMIRAYLEQLTAWTSRHARLVVWFGLLVSVIAPLSQTSYAIAYDRRSVHAELKREGDIHNLYYAAANARWSDMRRWWTGSWIYPEVGYYRPLTSMLFLFEFRTFGSNFAAYNRISQILHHVNLGLVYLLTVSLFRAHRISRACLGLIAVYFFTSTANSMFFAVSRILSWWPAQNDALSLTFGLLCLLILDQYLHRPSRTVLAASLGCLFLSIAAKEMGFIVAPVGLALVAQRRLQGIGPWRAPVISIVSLTGFVWFLRRIRIPNHWGPVMFRWLILERMMLAWFGPPAMRAKAGILWPAAAGLAVTAIVSTGLYRRWSIYWIAGLSGLAVCLCAQFVGEDPSAVILLDPTGLALLWPVLIYLLAGALFIRYARILPALFTGCALWLVYLPILQYGGGAHYYYWPGAFNAIADAAFVASLWRWAGELRTGGNWDLRRTPVKDSAQRENATVSLKNR